MIVTIWASQYSSEAEMWGVKTAQILFWNVTEPVELQWVNNQGDPLLLSYRKIWCKIRALFLTGLAEAPSSHMGREAYISTPLNVQLAWQQMQGSLFLACKLHISDNKGKTLTEKHHKSIIKFVFVFVYLEEKPEMHSLFLKKIM